MASLMVFVSLFETCAPAQKASASASPASRVKRLMRLLIVLRGKNVTLSWQSRVILNGEAGPYVWVT